MEQTQIERIKQTKTFMEAIAIYEDASLQQSSINHYNNYNNINKNDIHFSIQKLIQYHNWILEVLKNAEKRILLNVNTEKIEAIKSLCKG